MKNVTSCLVTRDTKVKGGVTGQRRNIINECVSSLRDI